MTFKTTILKEEPNRVLHWLGHLIMPGLFDGEHIFTLSASVTSSDKLMTTFSW
jgi:hypothetical protein